ncbi:MAG: DUF2628 domain-containing protein [Oscillospiraceae bacterium]|nr:DUF2628 domain-containing protein [Oscillospiraceae bacterium]
MGKYTGCECIICQKRFTDKDTIVVCPECGTPYHRECYQTTGKCINEALHAVGGSWQSVQNEQRRQIGGIECSHCGYVNLPNARTCVSCNLPLLEEEEPDEINNAEDFVITTPDGQQHYFKASDPCCGISPEYKIEGERLGDVAHFVRTNTLYYIPLFRRFQETDRKLSFNLPCILFPYFYFANRKMWLMAILSGLLWIICSLPGMFLNMLDMMQDKTYLEMLQTNGMPQQAIDQITSFLTVHQELFETLQTPLFFAGIAIRLALCLFGNYLYFRFVLKSVKKIRLAAPTPSLKKALLSAEGGTNFWNVIGCFGLYFGLMFVLYLVLILTVW